MPPNAGREDGGCRSRSAVPPVGDARGAQRASGSFLEASYHESDEKQTPILKRFGVASPITGSFRWGCRDAKLSKGTKLALGVARVCCVSGCCAEAAKAWPDLVLLLLIAFPGCLSLFGDPQTASDTVQEEMISF